MYHLAHSLALMEYLLILWFKPSWKAHPHITQIGEPSSLCLACPCWTVGQVISSSSSGRYCALGLWYTLRPASRTLSHSANYRIMSSSLMEFTRKCDCYHRVHPDWPSPKIFPTPVVRRFLLLGAGNTACTTKLSHVSVLPCCTVEILQCTY